jgi:peptidoglycan/LPS O-acetylase OafA/YrhL
VSAYRPDIDGLRAVSIGLVVAYHAGIETVAGGYVGVDVFFVVSGFLITRLLIAEFERTGTVSLRQFVARRARRLLPLAGVVLTVTAIAGSWLMAPLQRPRLFEDLRSAALFVANWRFAGQATDYSDVGAADSLVNHWWSLAVEEQFYVVWPVIILGVAAAATRTRRVTVRTVLGVVIGVVVSGSLAASMVLTHRIGPEAYYLTHVRLWELGVGALLAVTLVRANGAPRRLPGALREVLAVGGLAAIVVAALRFDASTPFPGSAALVPVLGAAAVIASGAAGVTGAGRALGWWGFTRLGSWSYAWYLWHWPVIGLALIAADRWQWTAPTNVVIAGAVAASLVLAAASHHVIENPVRRASWLAVAPYRSLATGLVAVLLPVTLAAALNARVDAGEVQLALPADVVAMTPDEAAADVVDLPGSDDCNATIVQHAPGVDCVFGDPTGTVEVALLGDSHAQHWLPALHRVGLERSWRIHAFTKSACPAFDVAIWNNRLQRRYHECATWHAAVAERIAALDLDAVIVVNTHGYRTLLLDEAGGVLTSPTQALQQWAEATRTNVMRLLASASVVVRLHDTPWAPHDVPTCLSSHPQEHLRCSFPLADAVGRDAPLLEIERQVATELALGSRYRFVDTIALVCPDDPCRVVRNDGIVVFRDQHHLTQTVSTSLAGALARLLSPVLEPT